MRENAVMKLKTLKPGGYFMYHRVYQQILLLSAHRQRFCIWCVSRKNSYGFHTHPSLVLVTEKECVYCAVRTGSLTVIRIKCHF